jgi:transposase-like protein
MSKNTKRSPEEKMEIVLEGLQNDNISETCRKHGIYESQCRGFHSSSFLPPL